MSAEPKPKGWFRNLSITTKLTIVLILTAVTPLILLSGYNLYVHSQDLVNRSLEDLEQLAISHADLINRLVEDTRSTLYVISTDPEVAEYLKTAPDAPPEVSESAFAAFQNALDANPFYEYTYLLNRDGDVLISMQIDDLASIAGKNFADREYFIRGMAGEEHIDVLVGRISGKLGFYFSRPVYDENGEIVGVAAIKLRGDAITGIINDLNTETNDMSAILIDHDGIVVSPPRGLDDWLFHSIVELSPDVEARVKKRFVLDDVPVLGIPALARLDGVTESGSFFSLDQDEGQVVMGYAPVKPLNWVVGINIPPRILVNRVTDLILITLLAGFALSVVATIVAVFVARGITRPINELEAAAQRVEQDQPFAPSDIADVMSLQDEVGHLARTFSAMVVALRARIAELRTIFEISQEISAGIEFDETLQYILAAIHNVIPYDLAELSFYDEENRQMIVRATANYLKSDGDDAIAYYEPEIARTYPVDEGTLARLLSQGGALLLPDMKSDDDLDAGTLDKWDAATPRSYLGVVLKSKSKVLGALELVSAQPDTFTEDNSRLLVSIASQAAIEVQNVQEIQKREQRLAQQIQRMDIVIDKSKTTRQVEHIVTSDFFQEIQEKAKDIRAKQSSPEDVEQE